MDAGTERALCVRCVLPHSPPDITLDREGVCNLCRRDESQAPERREDPLLETDFVRILASHRGKGTHDCLVMCSGGKDSTAALYYMKRRYRMNPLAFMFDHGFEQQEAIDNVRRAVEILGVDLLFYRTDTLKDLFRRMIESGTRAVLCHPCSIWYMSLTFAMAARFDIPLIIAGWTRGQATRSGVAARYADEAPEYRSMARATREFLATLKGDPRFRDFPSSMEEAVARARKRHRATVLSPHWFLDDGEEDYVEVIRRELGWRPPAESYPEGSTNCEMNYVSVWNSMRCYGYTHYHVEMAKMVRQGWMTREEAIRRLRIRFDEAALRRVGDRLGVRIP
ncbi:hypothetical protein KBD49_15355 [Myxococcota bacterium]|nr:hypothetical protein [Myxococcota bacterium]